jgi:MFS family permease
MRDGIEISAAAEDRELSPPTASRIAVSLVFLIHGILVATWIARIPAIQERLHISVGTLGLALLGAPVGAVAAMPLTSRLVGRFGSARLTLISTLSLCVAVMLPALAWNAASLGLFLVAYGASAGAMDVAMNTQAVDVERAYARPVMVAFHALFSFGGMLGSLMGSFAAAHAITPTMHWAGVGLAMAAAGVYSCRNLLPDKVEVIVGGKKARELLAPLIGLGVIAFCILVGEGAMADWSAVYLNQLAGPVRAPLGYAVFSLTMALGRLAGDWFHEHAGSEKTVRYGSTLAALGMAFALILGTVPATLIGFGCVGFGFSAIFPIVCSVAGKKAGNQPQAGIAAVSATGYFGFLVGPPIIGGIAQWSSLRIALGFVGLLSVITVAVARAARVNKSEFRS